MRITTYQFTQINFIIFTAAYIIPLCGCTKVYLSLYGWTQVFSSIFCYIRNTATSNFVHVFFTLLVLYLQDKFIAMGLLGQRASAYIIC